MTAEETIQGGAQDAPKAARFVIGLVVTTSMIAVYTAVAYWLGFQLIDYFAGSFLGFAVGIWLAAPVMYALNFFRSRIERAILEEIEDSMLV